MPKIKNPDIEEENPSIEEASTAGTAAAEKEQEIEAEAAELPEATDDATETGEKEATQSNEPSKEKKPNSNFDPKYFKLQRDLKRARKEKEAILERLGKLENRFVENNQVDLDRSIKQTEADLAKLRDAKYKAINAGDRANEAKYEKAIDDRREYLQQLHTQQETVKSQIKKQPDERERLAKETAEELREEWTERNPWADDLSGDSDHMHVDAKQYMRHLAESGYYTNDPKFWELLDRKMQSLYPNLKNGGSTANNRIVGQVPVKSNTQQPPKSQPVSVVSGGGKVEGRSSYGLDPKRLQFLRDKGWSQSRIKAYAEYAKEFDKQEEDRRKER